MVRKVVTLVWKPT